MPAPLIPLVVGGASVAVETRLKGLSPEDNLLIPRAVLHAKWQQVEDKIKASKAQTTALHQEYERKKALQKTRQTECLRASVQYLMDREDIAFPRTEATSEQCSPLKVAHAMNYLLTQRVGIDAETMDFLLSVDHQPIISAKAIIGMKNSKRTSRMEYKQFSALL